MAMPDVVTPLATPAVWEQRAELRSRSTSPVNRTGRLQQDIHVFVAKHGSGRLEDMLSQEALNKVKIKLKIKGWTISNSSLVLGERRLLQQEVLSELAQDVDSQAPFLHIAVRLADIQSAYFSNTAGQQLTFDLGGSNAEDRRPRRSALTSALAQGATVPADATSNSLVVRGQFLRAGEEVERALTETDSSSDGGAVVHLVVRRTAKLSWNVCGSSSFELTICASDPADLVKRRAEAATGLPHGSHLLLHNGQVLAGRSLCEYGVRKGSVLELVPYYEPSVPQSLPEGSPLLSSPDHELFDGFQAAREGLRSGHAPKLAASGTGGSYFISNASGQPVAVFKPCDEEALAPHNPKQHKGLLSSPSDHGLRRGIRPGEGAVREVAAYLLDHEHFAGVPPTALVSCHDSGPLPSEYSKIGSLQAYVKAEGDCEEWGVSQFPTHEVHKIAILDMRLGNCDRNGGNILVRKGADGARQLVPIDHGNTLPDTFTDISFEWMYWPQARAPLDAACLAYIQRMDADRDLGILAQHGLALRPECARVLRVLTALLRRSAARGLTPFDIASIMCREGFGKSPLEKLHSRAMRRTVSHGPGPSKVHAASMKSAPLSAAAEPVYLRHMNELIDEYLDETVLAGLAPGA